MALSTMGWVYVGVLALFAAAFLATFLKLRRVLPATSEPEAPPASATPAETASTEDARE